jgi:hypothetical protein
VGAALNTKLRLVRKVADQRGSVNERRYSRRICCARRLGPSGLCPDCGRAITLGRSGTESGRFGFHAQVAGRGQSRRSNPAGPCDYRRGRGRAVPDTIVSGRRATFEQNRNSSDSGRREGRPARFGLCGGPRARSWDAMVELGMAVWWARGWFWRAG